MSIVTFYSLYNALTHSACHIDNIEYFINIYYLFMEEIDDIQNVLYVV